MQGNEQGERNDPMAKGVKGAKPGDKKGKNAKSAKKDGGCNVQ